VEAVSTIAGQIACGLESSNGGWRHLHPGKGQVSVFIPGENFLLSATPEIVAANSSLFGREYIMIPAKVCSLEGGYVRDS